MTATDEVQQARPAGLRERKKAETRNRLADTAAKMFIERGYENVRMVDIAQAADVSEQTLYNYFPTKEHLIFDRDREFEELILRAATERLPGQKLSDTVRAGALQFLDQISPAIGNPSWVPASVASGPELRRVWLEINARCADALTAALVETARGKITRPVAKLMARSIVACFAVIVEGIGEGSAEGKRRDAIIKEMRAAIEACAQIIECGISS